MKFADTILILGVSGCVFLPVVKMLRKDLKLVVNIDGLEWKRQKWGRVAKWFLKLSEKLAVKFSDVVVSDNKVIQDYIHNQYSVESCLISYGADHVRKLLISDELLEQYNFLADPYAFTVCRIEPENNIHIILAALKRFGQLNMVIVGNWDNSDYGKELKHEFSHHENLFLLDPIYEQDVLDQLRSNCSIYLHGHSAGGTNPSLVEAMYLELPILAFDVDFNRVTTKELALYFDDIDSLISHLSTVDENRLNKIGHDVKNVADKYYTWSYVSSRYEEIL
jgi:glycosyltransferase involved in cell wall biosynthesis